MSSAVSVRNAVIAVVMPASRLPSNFYVTEDFVVAGERQVFYELGRALEDAPYAPLLGRQDVKVDAQGPVDAAPRVSSSVSRELPEVDSVADPVGLSSFVVDVASRCGRW